MSAFNTTIQRWGKDKDKIIFTMEALEDLFIRFAEEKLNETSPNFIYGSNHFGKSILSFVWEYLWKVVQIFHKVLEVEVIALLFHQN